MYIFKLQLKQGKQPLTNANHGMTHAAVLTSQDCLEGL